MSGASTVEQKIPVKSMTGFSSIESLIEGIRFKLEMKALNHRFLDLKVRVPRELSSLELVLRSAVQSRFTRGSIEVKLEQISDESLPPGSEISSASAGPRADLPLARQYYASLEQIRGALGIQEPIRLSDVLNCQDVIIFAENKLSPDKAGPELDAFVAKAIEQLDQMRIREGELTRKVLLDALAELERASEVLRMRRRECEEAYKSKIRAKIQSIFEAFPLTDSSIQAVLDTRIAQELALLLDRTDIEEELSRFSGHLDHFRKVISSGGPVGRKLEFILQELNREVNTLGTKAQDFLIGEEVVQAKVRLEQMREQALNLE